MDVCLIVRQYPRSLDEPIVSGSIKNPFYLSRFLASQGHEVSVIAHAEDPQTTIQNGVCVHRVPQGWLRGVGKTVSNGLLAARKVRRLEQVQPFEVVNAHYPTAAIGLFREVGRWDTPLVSTAHGTILPEIRANVGARSPRDLAHLVNALARKQVDQYAWDRSDLIVSAGEFQVNEMVEMYGINYQKVRPIANGVDTEFYCPDDGLRRDARVELGFENQKVVLFVGRLVKKKGVQHLLHAASAIRSEVPEVQFLVVGGTEQFDDYGESLRALIRRLDLGDCVHMISGVPERQMPAYYNAADVCVVPSVRYEPLPTVVFEGMACAKPIVATNTGGIPDQLGQTESTVQEASPEELAEQTVSFLVDTDLRERHAERNRQRAVETFDWRQTVQKYEQAYRDVI